VKIRLCYLCVSVVHFVFYSEHLERPEAIAQQSSPVESLPEELLDRVVPKNLFDVINENLLSTSSISLLAKQCLSRARDAF
jgi:hypothetical protein